MLALDTALNACSLALVERGKLRAVSSRAMSAGHAEHLAPMAAALFHEAGSAPLDMDRIGVVSGPGQFAGVRIGLAFAKGLAIGGRAAVLGISSLEALAESAGGVWDGPRAAIIDARRGEAYAALYERPGAPRIAPHIAPIDAIIEAFAADTGEGALFVCGSGVALLAGKAPSVWRLDTSLVAIDILAVARLAASSDPAQRPASPLYLRAPDAAPAKPSRFAAIGPTT